MYSHYKHLKKGVMQMEKHRKDYKAHQLPSGNWRVLLILGYDENGKRKTKSFTAPTDWEALKKAAEYENGVREQREHMTVKQAIRNYIDDRKNLIAPTTLNNYEYILKKRFTTIQNIDIHDLTARDIQRAINADAEDVGYAIIKTALAVLRSALAVYGVKVESPTHYRLPQKPPPKGELPTAKQIREIVTGTNIELPVMLSMCCGGMRVSEVRGLQYRDITTDDKGQHFVCICRVRNFSNGHDVLQNRNKTADSTRTVPMPDDVYSLVMAQEHSADTDFVVDVQYGTLKKRYKTLMSKHGYNLKFHDLRKIFATTMRDIGVPLEVVEKMGGWSNSTVLRQVYIRTTKKQVLDGMSAFENAVFND